MAEFDYELLLQRLENLIQKGDKLTKGTIVRAGTTVQVNIGNGRFVKAENLGVLTPGEVGVIRSGNNWYVYPLKQTGIVSQRISSNL
jgi:hypothetical protein